MERLVITLKRGGQTAKAKTVSHYRNLNGQRQLRLHMIMNPFGDRQTRYEPIAVKCLAVHRYHHTSKKREFKQMRPYG